MALGSGLPVDAKPLLTIATFKGLNTNSAHGTHEQPTVLDNAYLDRTGGYNPQYARSSQLTGVIWAWSAGVGADLFYTSGSGMNYYAAQTRTSTAIAGVTGSTTGVQVMPGLLMTSTDGPQTPLTSAGSGARLAATYLNQYVYKDGITTAGGVGTAGDLTVTFDAASAGPPAEVGFSNTATWEFYVIYASPDYRSAGHFTQARSFYFTSTGGAPNPFVPVLNYTTGNGSIGGTVYYRLAGSADPWKIGSRTTGTSSFPGAWRVQKLDLGLDADAVGYFGFRTTPTMPHEYHKGRAYIAPDSYQYFDPSPNTGGLAQESLPSRVFYSDFIAAASLKASPTWGLLRFLDVPFRVSQRVVALLSVQAYLYIFGDRELFILTGDPEDGGRVESIGDSIGTVSPGSVQQLDGVGYWVSDSGVMAVRGGQVQEVGADVRDLVGSMAPGSITSTVDFGRELYIISDGTLTLCYSARENAWSTRQQSESGTLIYGGGTPYALGGTTLYSIGGERDSGNALPARLVLTVTWGPFECGSWNTRKQFVGMALGVDLATTNATVTQQSRVLQRNQAVTSDAQVANVLPGPGYSVTRLVQDETGMSGHSVEPHYIMSSQDSRAILRPPLVVYGVPGTGEVEVD